MHARYGSTIQVPCPILSLRCPTKVTVCCKPLPQRCIIPPCACPHPFALCHSAGSTSTGPRRGHRRLFLEGATWAPRTGYIYTPAQGCPWKLLGLAPGLAKAQVGLFQEAAQQQHYEQQSEHMATANGDPLRPGFDHEVSSLGDWHGREASPLKGGLHLGNNRCQAFCGTQLRQLYIHTPLTSR